MKYRKNFPFFFWLLLICGATHVNGQGYSCSFAPFTPQSSNLGACLAPIQLDCPELIAPDCGCYPDPNAAPQIINRHFDFQFVEFPPGSGEFHLDSMAIDFGIVPEAGCADVTIKMTAVGDLSSRPFEDIVLVDEDGNIICRVGGIDCETVTSTCTMSFCEFNLQAQGGLRLKTLPNSLITNGTAHPFCGDNWVDIELTIPQSNLRAVNDLTGLCGGSVVLPYGTHHIVWTSYNKYNCQEITATQEITIGDDNPPVIIGCPKAVIINLGPGECEASWDAPPFMAMDDCPSGILRLGAERISPACQSTPNIVWNPGFYGGNMFDIQNVSGQAFVLHGIDVAWRNMDSVLLFYTTAPGSHLPVRFNSTAWTQCPTAVWAPGGGGAFPAPARRYIDFRTYTVFSQTTCTGTITDTVSVSCPTIQPGEVRGVYFAGKAGVGGMYWSSNGCTTAGAPWGDANLKILKTPAMSCVYGTGYFGVGGGLAITGNQQFVGNLRYSYPSSDNMVRVVQTCGQPYGPGCYFPIGCVTLCYEATDASGNTATCEFEVCVNEYQNPVDHLACHDLIQVSLDENCFATISADEILTGGPYHCFDDYTIELRDWITNLVIDRQPTVPGAQVSVQDIGRKIMVTVIDTETGNSCWGSAIVEDKLPPILTCARDTCVVCGTTPTSPAYMGIPGVDENCGGYSLTYRDNVTQGGCAAGYEELIVRTWTAEDAYGNKDQCVQTITVSLATLSSIDVPLNFDDIESPALACDGKINTKDYSPHYLPYPYCVDGYLLDSAHWFATGGFLPSPTGDLAGERLPRTLGWNCLDTGLYIGHPSPWPIYWPAHPSWRPNNPVCWGPDEIVQWHGTGYPTGSGCSNLGVTFQDIIIDIARPGCDAGPIGCYKVLRQWTVLDWCSSDIGGHNQVIKVIDREGPEILYPDTIIVNMDVWTCTGKWEVPKPWLIDNCSNELHYSLESETGTILGNDEAGFIIVDMEPGEWSVYIIAEDCCGSITRKRVAVNVQDNVPPVAVCDQRTVVSINGNQSPGENFAKIFANDLDQGSFDNCSHHVFFKVIRMEHLRGTNNGSNTAQPDNGTNCAAINGDDNAILEGNQIYFDDHVKFCCTDVGNTIMVVLRVFDREPGAGPIAPTRMNPGGNLFNRFSDCMIEVEVQDKSVPTVVAPPNIVVSCWFWFDVDKLTDPNDPTFGRVVNDLSARKKVVTRDLVCHNYCVRNDITGYPGFVPGAPPSNPPAWNRACEYYQVLFDTAHADRKYELTWGFDGTVLGACGTNFSISVNDNRECGQGQLTRTVVARGPNNISVTQTQTIWVVDCDPFYINREDNCDATDDISWPGNCTGQATTLAGCGADISPDNPVLGRPVIENNADDLCALISIEYFDEVFTIEPDACFKVLRHWTVIDWCQYDPNLDPVRGRWEYLQIIKVSDKIKPVVSVSIGDCEPATKTNGICYGHMTLTATATDDCSPLDWLFYEYKIDAFNDGKGKYPGFDFIVGPLTQKEFAAGRAPKFNDNPQADFPGNPFDASGNYPVGVHKICWHVEDGCGNIGINCQLFEIKDCKAPTPYCHVGLITTVMPANGCVTLWAKDFDAGSYDNCTAPEDLHIYFGDYDSDSLTICCEDFVNNRVNDELIIPVVICVEDEEGNEDCCQTTLVVQDPNNVCPDVGSYGKISGELRTQSNEETQDADVQLFESAVMTKQMVTSNNGKYFFGELLWGGSREYVVKPGRNDDPLNGVTTADIVKIQRHLLGLEELISPYKLIAADVNASKTVSTADISELRKLILGVVDKFSKSESWTFVPSKFIFDNPREPWNAPRQAVVPMAAAQEFVEDFVAIKIGDVNNTVRGRNAVGSSSRSGERLSLEIEDGELVAGEVYDMAFLSSNFQDIAAYQFTLRFDQQVLAFEGFEPGVLALDVSNFGTQRIGNGLLSTSWNEKEGKSCQGDQVLFTLKFRALADGRVSKLVTINSEITQAEAYDASLQPRDIGLSVRRDGIVSETALFELFQNTPNPFAKESAIRFNLPDAGPATLGIYDLTGKLVRLYDIMGVKGTNEVIVKRSELGSGSVLYYQLDASGYSATKRMLLLD
ncbi:MAG: HYR domain-containing protein [Saprospiraceae bacterium]|jgi:hypothetical protein|nr:HYR domain-containing protein [Saprospiraceae bacterium]